MNPKCERMVRQISAKVYQQLGYSPADVAALRWVDTAWRKLPAGQV